MCVNANIQAIENIHRRRAIRTLAHLKDVTVVEVNVIPPARGNCRWTIVFKVTSPYSEYIEACHPKDPTIWNVANPTINAIKKKIKMEISKEE